MKASDWVEWIHSLVQCEFESVWLWAHRVRNTSTLENLSENMYEFRVVEALQIFFMDFYNHFFWVTYFYFWDIQAQFWSGMDLSYSPGMLSFKLDHRPGIKSILTVIYLAYHLCLPGWLRKISIPKGLSLLAFNLLALKHWFIR